MACSGPALMRGLVRPCYRCDGCRRARAADLVTRLLVETLGHKLACLVTLTYADEFLPPLRSLNRAHARSFLKRLRRAVEYHGGGRGLRLFLVGEYGTLSGRPHYHLIVWGADASTVWDGRSFSDLVAAAWSMGRIDVGTYWSDRAAGYVAGYVSKGLNVKGLSILGGRIPEFSIYPKPGLGQAGVPRALELLVADEDPMAVIDGLGDLPGRLDLGGSQRLVRGLLKDKLRLAAGVPRRRIGAVKERKQMLALGRDVSVAAVARRRAERSIFNLLWEVDDDE